MNRLRLVRRRYNDDLLLAWGGATVLVLLVSLLIETLR